LHARKGHTTHIRGLLRSDVAGLGLLQELLALVLREASERVSGIGGVVKVHRSVSGRGGLAVRFRRLAIKSRVSSRQNFRAKHIRGRRRELLKAVKV
jgi:hypothetical protein